MFFLLRMAFWLGVVLILLPAGGAPRGSSANQVDASEAISAASATVHDLKGFCARQPNACTVGSELARTMGYKAQAGAKMLYNLLTEVVAPHDAPTAHDSIAPRDTMTPREAIAPRDTMTPREAAAPRDTGSLGNDRNRSALRKPSPPQASQNTLTPADLVPAWRGPPIRKIADRST